MIELDNTVQFLYNCFMKECTVCREIKPEDDFAWRNKALGKRHSYCKACRRKSDNAIWKDGDKKKTKQITRQALRKKREEYIVSVLKSGCADCGEANILVLEFDHLQDKVMNISQMLSDGYSLSAIEKEIAKCQVVCANDHKIRTQLRANSWRLNYVDIL